MYIQNMFKWSFDFSILVVQLSLYRWANSFFVLPVTRIIEKSAPSLGTIIPFSGQQLFEMTNSYWFYIGRYALFLVPKRMKITS